jgi:hypothetical protein
MGRRTRIATLLLCSAVGLTACGSSTSNQSTVAATPALARSGVCLALGMWLDSNQPAKTYFDLMTADAPKAGEQFMVDVGSIEGAPTPAELQAWVAQLERDCDAAGDHLAWP